MILDELIAQLMALRKTPEDGQLEVVLEPDAWAKNDFMEIDGIEREADRFMIRWGC